MAILDRRSKALAFTIGMIALDLTQHYYQHHHGHHHHHHHDDDSLGLLEALAAGAVWFVVSSAARYGVSYVTNKQAPVHGFCASGAELALGVYFGNAPINTLFRMGTAACVAIGISEATATHKPK